MAGRNAIDKELEEQVDKNGTPENGAALQREKSRCDSPGSQADIEPDLDELLAYESVPFRKTVMIPVRCNLAGRLQPLPYPFEEEEGGGCR